MRIAVVSDIHSNLDAFEAVLAAAQPFDQLWSLGDIVGYGPEPNECVARLHDFKHLAVAGNHDWAAVGRIGTEAFNPYAAAATRWTMEQISAETRAFLLNLAPTVKSGEFSLAHGSPRSPIWEYVLNVAIASPCFDYFDGPFCLVGHTHIPGVFVRLENGQVIANRVQGDAELRLDQPGCRFILNPGSVGQPRDHDARASYLIIDTDRRAAAWRRVAYPIQSTQEKMRRARLPARLVERLTSGW